MLYNLLIGPLELLFEFVFVFANRIIQNPGLSIIALSLVVNFLVLPLYKKADDMQAEQRETEEKLKHWVTHIKKTFKGDERFMMLQTYYRQNNYKPTDALKGSMSLLLEIPFFMAAYNFLSGLQILQGRSFGPIHDLGAPDAMLVIGGIAINVLPILMTVLNIISGIIYTKGFSLKSKVQLYGMAVIFLVLLYNSPSGLVFYWTLNNLFSLCKNVFYKMKDPKKTLCMLSSVSGIALLVYITFFRHMPTVRSQILVSILLLMMQLPIAVYYIAKHTAKRPAPEITKAERIAFHMGGLFLAILTGLMIPSNVIKSSPEEFINQISMINPLWYVVNAFLTAAGLFVVWFGIFYLLAAPKAQRIIGFAVWAASGVAVVDHMFFGNDFGTLNARLMYNLPPQFPWEMQLLNLLAVIAVTGIMVIVWYKKRELIRAVYVSFIAAMLGISVFNMGSIQKVTVKMFEKIKAGENAIATIPLSKNGKNVVILMLDRAIGSFVPYMLEEKPELKEQFAGFTYYPNTISFGAFTNAGSPALYGGYEYTPEELNKRADEYLEDKHNEALKVMPVLFDENDFDVTVCDPSYAGYDWTPDLSIYDEYPDIKKYRTIGTMGRFKEEDALQTEHIMERNFFCYSIFKITPTCLQDFLYSDGIYNEADAMPSWIKDPVSFQQITFDRSTSIGYQQLFLNSYEVLEEMKSITDIRDDSNDTFLMMSNDTAHEPSLLSEPEYTPAQNVDNKKYDAQHEDRFELGGKTLDMAQPHQMSHYHVNMASFLKLGEWFDYLRENGVYDNTRIILVSDHGRGIYARGDLVYEGFDTMWFNCLLMVKDFNSTEFTTDQTFMTNADTPLLAMKDMIADPTNPFTGKLITGKDKEKPEQHLFFSDLWSTNTNSGKQFLPGDWYAVHDDARDMKNWRQLSQNSVSPGA